MNIGLRVAGCGLWLYRAARFRVAPVADVALIIAGMSAVLATSATSAAAAPGAGAVSANIANASATNATAASATAASATAASVAAPSPTTERSVLGNGVTLVVRTDRTAPRVALSLLVRVGAADETTETAGWRRLLAEAMLRASIERAGQGAQSAMAPADAPAPQAPAPSPQSPTLTGTQLQRRAEALGGRIGAGVGDDVIEFWAVGDSASAGTLLDLLLTVALRPRLAEADVAAARRRVLARIESEQNDIRTLATSALRGQLYRDARGEPLAYGLAEHGTRQSLEALTRDKLGDYHRRYFQASRLTLAAAGDVDTAVLRARLAQIAASGSAGAPPGAAPPFAPPGKSDPLLIVRQVAPQLERPRDAWVFVSYLVAGFNHADGPALRVLAALLGESPNQSRARLPRRLMTAGPNRLTFGATPPTGAAQAAQTAALLTPRRFGGELVLFAQTDAGDVDAVKNALLDEARKLRETNPGAAELTRAKNFVRGSWAIDREALRDRAFQAGLAAALSPAPALAPGVASMSLPADTDYPARVARVTAADVRRVAQKYLSSYAVALIMPETTPR